MPKYYFHVVGFRHHAFKDRLEELYAQAEGNTMTLWIEEENKLQKNAVRVNLVDKFVGYVRRGYQCEMAEELMRKEQLGVVGDVIDIDKKYRLITLEVESEFEVDIEGKERVDELGGWHYDGDLLCQEDDDITLKCMLTNLERCAVRISPVNEKLMGYINYIQDNLWRDAGIESQHQLERCIQLFTANRNKQEGYMDIANRLASIATEANSPEKRQIQVDHLFELAHNNQVKGLIKELGEEKVKDIINGFPKFLLKLFENNPQEYVGKIWYIGCSYEKFRMLQTVMAMRIAMMDEGKYPDINADEVLMGEEKSLDCLSDVIEKYYNGSKKNLALIYCVLRDLKLLVDKDNYRKFFELLISRNILPWMTKKEFNNLVHSVSQYMKDRIDHGKRKEGFGEPYCNWENREERLICEEIAAYFIKELQI